MEKEIKDGEIKCDRCKIDTGYMKMVKGVYVCEDCLTKKEYETTT